MSTRKITTHSILRQASRGYFRSVWVEQPMIIFVQQGRKFLGTDQYSIYANNTEAAILSSDQLVNIENTPGDKHDYIADVFVFDKELVQTFYERAFPGIDILNNKTIDMLEVSSALRKALIEAKTALQSEDLSDTIIEHRVCELLLWLGEHGVFFTSGKTPTEVERVRKLLLSNIANDWKASEVASELGVSEPTLRRHLAKEETSFTEILSDLRLGKALELLQATDLPVTTIAYDLGFGSPSHFTERFKSRFDIPPTAIRKRMA